MAVEPQELEVVDDSILAEQESANVEAVGVYQSSEELQRANRDVFANAGAKKKADAHITEKQKLHKVLDKYIDEHSSTKKVREMVKKHDKGADFQLDVSAEVVTILEKIKNELR